MPRNQPYRPGELDQRVSLRRQTETKNEYATLVESFEEIATVWAHVRPMSGRERDAAQKTEATANYLVVIRNRDDIDHADHIRWRGRDLNIRFIKDASPRDLYLEIEAERGVP